MKCCPARVPWSSSGVAKYIFEITFYVKESCGLCSLTYLHQQFTVKIIFAHWMQLLEHRTYNTITGLIIWFYGIFVFYDFLSISQSLICHVWTVSIRAFRGLLRLNLKMPRPENTKSKFWSKNCQILKIK